ncbi:alpha/beta fold hydrolase [Streptomyces somaliensis]|nr:alpha/beta fold hydrolase [Streptomyces somaliensis]
MFEPLEGSVRSKDGTRIAYERSGTGPALIMVDPAGRYRELGSYRSLAKLLAQHFTVFVYDRRGRGASSDRQPYALEREIDDLAALIEAAGGSAFVYAMTSGALLALHAAAADLPIPALAVFEPPIRTDDSPGEKRDLTGELAELIAQGERARRRRTLPHGDRRPGGAGGRHARGAKLARAGGDRAHLRLRLQCFRRHDPRRHRLRRHPDSGHRQ